MDETMRLISAYRPCNEQEERDKQLILALMSGGDVYTRENEVAHLTASAWVVNRARDRVLLAYHNLYRSWAWLGGHADGERDLLATAQREVREESGLCCLNPIDGNIFSLEVLPVAGHEKKGRYVCSHLHLNLTYLIEADEHEPLREKPDENSGVAWFCPDEVARLVSEQWMYDRVYAKLIAKVKALKQRRGFFG